MGNKLGWILAGVLLAALIGVIVYFAVFPSPSGARDTLKEGMLDRHEIQADVSDVAANIDHAVRLVGIDHVGLGSDFDGVGENLPTGLKDVSDFPNLIYELLKRGYTEQDIRKICADNFLRVWSDIQNAAQANNSDQ